MSDAIGPGDLVLCVNAAPNHVTGWPVPLVAGETYRVFMVMDFPCPCGRSDALIDVGADHQACEDHQNAEHCDQQNSKTRHGRLPRLV